MSGKPAGKIISFILGAVVVLCVAGLGAYFLISNLHKNNLRKSIVSECPFTIAGDAEWKTYSNNNLAGLIAAVSEHDGQADRMILVLDKSAAKYSSASALRGIVLHYDYFQLSYSGWEDSWRNLEKKDVYESGHFIYLKVQYDGRATLTRIEIGIGASDSFSLDNGEGLMFDFSDPFEVTHYTYSGTVKNLSQEYDEKKSGWSAVSTYEYDRVVYD
jgi:hypothetical protein